jgi:transcriptional regulator with XRE-family HTH domain
MYGLRCGLYYYIFFKNVMRVLRARGMSKHDLSEQSGVSMSFLSDLTRGKANPSLKVMEAIAEALQIPLPLLLESSYLSGDDAEGLGEWKEPGSLKHGLVRVNALFPPQKAFIVMKWALRRDISAL